jgi:nitroreductase
MTDNIDFILKRRSIRKFEQRPVEEEKIITLLRAGMAAPSAMNSQPWEFVVVTDEPLLASMRAVMEYGKMVSPLVIVPLGSPRVASNPAGETFWPQDCVAAVENILIAAANIGLGAVWVGVYPRTRRMDALRGILNIPADVFPLALLYIGYPAEQKPANSKYKAERVHRQKYESTRRYDQKFINRLVDKVIKKV